MKKILTESDVVEAAMSLLAARKKINSGTLLDVLGRGSKTTIIQMWLKVQPAIEEALRESGAFPPVKTARTQFERFSAEIRQDERARMASEIQEIEVQMQEAVAANEALRSEHEDALRQARVESDESLSKSADLLAAETSRNLDLARKLDEASNNLTVEKAKAAGLQSRLDDAQASHKRELEGVQVTLDQQKAHVESLKAAAKASADLASATESRLTVALQAAKSDADIARQDANDRLMLSDEKVTQLNAALAALRERVATLESTNAELTRSADVARATTNATIAELQGRLAASDADARANNDAKTAALVANAALEVRLSHQQDQTSSLTRELEAARRAAEPVAPMKSRRTT